MNDSVYETIFMPPEVRCHIILSCKHAMDDNELLDDFIDLFLDLANHNGYLSAEC